MKQIRQLFHEKEFDTKTLFTDIGPVAEDTKETVDRKTIAESERKASPDQKTQEYQPRPLTPDDDIYEDIIEQFATAPTKPKYWFEEFGDYWSCSCGHINRGDICKSCGLERELLRSLFILHKPADAPGKLDKKLKKAKSQADMEAEQQAKAEHRRKKREASGDDKKVVPIEEDAKRMDSAKNSSSVDGAADDSADASAGNRQNLPAVKSEDKSAVKKSASAAKSGSLLNAAALNKKIIIAIAACLALIVGAAAAVYTYVERSVSQQEEAQRLQTDVTYGESLAPFAAVLKISDPEALIEKVNAAKLAYVQEHLSERSAQVESYMSQLMSVKYPGIQEIYDQYYAWHVSIIANTSENDFSSDIDTVSRKDTVYFHAILSGGEPNETLELYYEVTWPNGSSQIYGLDSLWQSGSKITARFQYPIPLFGAEGKLTFNLYNKNTNELMGSDTVTFRN